MANKVITVTDPSVVTNDTLLGYNNYSDIDGQLGTTMTPTEATNGKTITLSDGVVHEVTTKPVGTTNGEFSAAVSNAVTVDLAGGFQAPTFTLNANITDEGGNVYSAPDTNGGFNGRGETDIVYSGDFHFSMDLVSQLRSKNATINVNTISSIDVDDNLPADWTYGVYIRGADDKSCYLSAGTGVSIGGVRVYGAGNTISVRRVSGNLSVYYNEEVVYDYGTVTDTVNLQIAPFADQFIDNPLVEV